jgi:hypothetical protein
MDAKTILRSYEDVLNDIHESKNLDHHLKEIESEIELMNGFIKRAVEAGIEKQGFDVWKNQLFYLKWQILERNCD